MLDHFNEKINLECYDSIKPPKIPLENINMNSSILMINAMNDNLANLKDVAKLQQRLKGNIKSKFNKFYFGTNF